MALHFCGPVCIWAWACSCTWLRRPCSSLLISSRCCSRRRTLCSGPPCSNLSDATVRQVGDQPPKNITHEPTDSTCKSRHKCTDNRRATKCAHTFEAVYMKKRMIRYLPGQRSGTSAALALPAGPGQPAVVLQSPTQAEKPHELPNHR